MIKQLDQTPRRKKRSVLKILTLAFGILGIFILLVQIFGLTDIFFKAPKTVVNLITDSGLKSDNNRVNTLLLGIGGEGHEGPNLSDTMILASVEKHGKDIAIVNIPRDLWVPDLKSKINAAYAYGQDQNGKGLELAKNTVSRLFGLPVHYAFRLDFDGFINAIDLVEGLDIDVENSFVDYRYPIPGNEGETCGIEIEEKEGLTYFMDATGSAVLLTEENDPFICRYETIKFSQGPIHMDGATALKFVRSRHGTNGENSDFKRSARQEKVLMAFRQRVFSAETLLNPKRIIDLASTFGNSIDTDIGTDEIPIFAKLAQKAKGTHIRRVVLDSGREQSVLEDGNPADYAGAFALVPKNNQWQELAEYVQGEIFKTTETEISSPPPKK